MQLQAWWTLCLPLGTCFAAMSIEEDLLRKLGVGVLDTRVQPTNPDENSSQLMVNCTRFTVDRILDLNQKAQRLDVLALVELSWYDQRMIWNPPDFAGIKRVRVAAGDIWLPDVVLINGVGTQVPFDDVLANRDNFAMLNPDGRISYQLYLQLNSICPMNAKMFPFDHQSCNLTFGSWTTDRIAATISESAKVGPNEDFSDHGEWWIDEAIPYSDVLLNTSRPHVGIAEDVHVNWTIFQRHGFIITLQLHRKSYYYLNNVFFPVTLLTVLTLANIKIPARCFKENIAMGLSIFIAQSWYLIMIAPELPITPSYVPLISTCIVLSMGFTCMTLLFSIMVIHVHAQTAKVRPSPPSWLLSMSHCVNGKGDSSDAMETGADKKRVQRQSCSCVDPMGSYDLLNNSGEQMSGSQTNPFKAEDIADDIEEETDVSDLLSPLLRQSSTEETLIDAVDDDGAAPTISDDRPTTETAHRDSSWREESDANLSYLLLMQNVLSKKYQTENKMSHDKKVEEWELVANAANQIFFWISCLLVVLAIAFLLVINSSGVH